MKSLRECLLPTSAQLIDNDPSHIYYLELLDENADSVETMSVVAEMIIEKMKTSTQESVVLVGDGKTFVHLQKARRMYYHEFRNIHIYPGDWHVLKNYQEVLMKCYYHTGLKEIAMGSGYKAETLNSLERCSNFKRTHSFLIQAWEALYLEMIKAFTLIYSDVPEELYSTLETSSSPQDLLLRVQEILEEAAINQD
jgi:hypothetical protein